MATEQDGIGVKETQHSRKQDNAESLDRKASSSKTNVDNGENQVSNGTQSTPPQPGIARVGNTGAENDE